MNTQEYLKRGEDYLDKGDFDRAIAEFSEAIRLNPTAVAYDKREEAYKKKGRHDLAAKDAAKAVTLSIEALSEDEIKMLMTAINADDKNQCSTETAEAHPAALTQAEKNALLSGGTGGDYEQRGAIEVLSKHEVEQLSAMLRDSMEDI